MFPEFIIFYTLITGSEMRRGRGERVFEQVHTEVTPRDRGHKAATVTHGTRPSDVRSIRHAMRWAH